MLNLNSWVVHVLVGQNLLNEGRVNPLSKAHDEVFSRFASFLPLRRSF